MKTRMIMMFAIIVMSIIAVGQTIQNPLPASQAPIAKKTQCDATTQAGTRCSRSVAEGKTKCAQHAKVKKADTKTYYIGPNGGKFYINKNGKKTYVKG